MCVGPAGGVRTFSSSRPRVSSMRSMRATRWALGVACAVAASGEHLATCRLCRRRGAQGRVRRRVAKASSMYPSAAGRSAQAAPSRMRGEGGRGGFVHVPQRGRSICAGCAEPDEGRGRARLRSAARHMATARATSRRRRRSYARAGRWLTAPQLRPHRAAATPAGASLPRARAWAEGLRRSRRDTVLPQRGRF